jgi:hypothetical protein
MRYYYNQEYGIILYPDNWFDVVRSLLTVLIHPTFKKTWSWWAFNKQTLGCIEHELTETAYPDEASG